VYPSALPDRHSAPLTAVDVSSLSLAAAKLQRTATFSNMNALSVFKGTSIEAINVYDAGWWAGLVLNSILFNG